MFEISATELLVIAVVAIVVIGPKDLPDMLRGLGRAVRKLRSMAGDFQRQVDQAGFADVRKSIEEVRSLTSPSGALARSITSSLETMDSKTTVEQKAVAPASSKAGQDSVAEGDGSHNSGAVAASEREASGPEPSSHDIPAARAPAAAAEGVDTTVVRVSSANNQQEAVPDAVTEAATENKPAADSADRGRAG